MANALMIEPKPQPSLPRGRVVRVMIVDDSVVARAVLARMLSGRPDFEVVAQAASAREALLLLADRPVDIILLDLEMPGIGGLDALPDLVAQGRGARVLIVSSACGEGAASTVQALRLGAADTLLKPGATGFAGRFAEELAERMRRLTAPAPADAAQSSSEAMSSIDGVEKPRRMDCIGIGASTGGVHALAEFLKALPSSVMAPILITQHLPAPFMPYFVPQLAEMAGRPVRLAAPGLQPMPGEILLAPGEGSLTLMRTGDLVHVRLERTRSASGCLPSVDPMLSSIAKIYGAGAIGVILSGMGRDGAAGAKLLVRDGGTMFAQDQATSVVWGMPGVVASAGLAELIAPPDVLARAIGARDAGAIAWR